MLIPISTNDLSLVVIENYIFSPVFPKPFASLEVNSPFWLIKIRIVFMRIYAGRVVDFFVNEIGAFVAPVFWQSSSLDRARWE